ncbi:unnamed protein product [Ostreobium quekettii]|uniref:Protein kinase domain-containing protein n=1 Tax=Ostreobium quekettii TaxID=121088 RepID=A0A8S1J0A1_9CHLO|nr:unnamed protein product [Ostreobium quekettii]|eukprot:evm.model.scf_1574.2 EVM.evm.TU.scf_1574.2   scf_1574:24784-26781(-)
MSFFQNFIYQQVWDCPENVVTTKSDVFSIGVVAYEVVSGKAPYSWHGFLSSTELRSLKTDRWEEPCPVRPIDCPTELHKLLKRCCSADPSEHPTMEMVNQCMMQLPKEWSQQVDTEALSRRANKRLRQSNGHVAFLLQYNNRLMEFLAQQMEKVITVIQRMPEEPATAREAQEWRVSWFDLDDAVYMGCSLIKRHSKKFDLQNFYAVSEAEEGVQKVCKKLQTVVARWKLDIQIDTIVPDAAMTGDYRFLHSCLSFLFQEGTIDKLPKKARVEDWLRVQKRLDEQFSRLKMVSEKEIVFGQPIESGRSVVYRARWNEIDVAVKRLLLRGAPDFSPQEFVKFYTDAFIQASLSHPHITELVAVSKSGLIVMELASCDLETLYKEAHLDWRTKYRFLIQVAEPLEYVQSRDPPVVHCDLKSLNILMFGDRENLESCAAQLSDFGISVEDTSTASVTVRRPGGTPHWMAPENYDEVHPFEAADVFNFGVVMYEILSQTPPFGSKGTSCERIYIMKCEGQPACKLPDDCPFNLRELMERCCSVDPSNRPTMQKVKKLLRNAAKAYECVHTCLASGKFIGTRSVVWQARSVPSQWSGRMGVKGAYCWPFLIGTPWT